MANYKKDAGLEYLQEIGFNRIKTSNGFVARFDALYGREKAKEVYAEMNSIPRSTMEFYDFKNSDPELSKALTEYYDGDIIRKACNYIDSHREIFGNTILEVGCESGYMTGFLARAFPDSRIVSIDRSQAALNMAKTRLEARGIKNVEFRVADLEDIEEQYDTVFCMRTIQENISYDDAPFSGEALLAQILQFSEVTRDYNSKLISRLKDKGELCIFERVSHDPLMCGWMMELCNQKCAPDVDTYQEFKCEEAGNINIFQAFVCHNGSEVDPQKMIDLWCSSFNEDISGRVQLSGYHALLYLWRQAGKLVRGIRILNEENKQIGRFALFYDKDYEEVMYYLNAPGGDEILVISVPADQKEIGLKKLQTTIEENEALGYHYEEIDPDEDIVEGID